MRRAKIKGERIRLEVPCRAHLSVLNMNLFSPGKPGGGGIGFPLPFKINLEISLSQDFKYSGPEEYKVGLRRILKAFKSDVDYEENFNVKVEGNIPSHAGFGSHTSIYSGTLFGANLLLGRPYSVREIREIVGRNYYEEKGPGFETGVGPAAILYSSFVVISDGLEILAAKKMPEEFHVIAVIPEIKRDINEKELLMKYGRILDLIDGGAKSKEVLLRLYPRLCRGDWKGVGDSIWRLQHLGSKLVEILQYKEWPKIFEAMRKIREYGGIIVGMSSLGPTIIGIFEEKRHFKAEEVGLNGKVVEGKMKDSSLSFEMRRGGRFQE